MAVVCYHGDGLPVIASQNSKHRNCPLRFERNAVADAKLQHGFVGMQLTYKSEALHNAVIQVYEFGFGQMIYVDAIHIVCRAVNTRRAFVPAVRESRTLITVRSESVLYDEQIGIIRPKGKLRIRPALWKMRALKSSSRAR